MFTWNCKNLIGTKRKTTVHNKLLSKIELNETEEFTDLLLPNDINILRDSRSINLILVRHISICKYIFEDTVQCEWCWCSNLLFFTCFGQQMTIFRGSCLLTCWKLTLQCHYIHLEYTGCPKKKVLTSNVCESIVPRSLICLEHVGHQFEHRGTRTH
jgi:hypothetical protein